MEEAKTVFPAGGTIEVLDRASVPKSPISPKRTLNLVIGFFLGIMISIALTFVLEYMDKTIKTEDDVKRYLGLPGIGIIPQLPEVNKNTTILSERTMISKQVEV
nr:GNVR domain-containing protein [Clostridium pascui]